MPETDISHDKETIDYLIGLGKVETVTLPNGGVAIITPTNRFVSIYHGPDAMLANHIDQDVTLTAIESLIDYVNAFKGSETRIFADPHAFSMAAVLDYHEAAAKVPDYTEHVARLVLEFSPEYLAWTKAASGLLGQVDFAEFVEDNDADVIDPPAASLKEAILDLKSHTNVEWKSKVNLVNGEYEMTYAETGASGGVIRLPEELEIAIPIFRNDPERVRIRVLLRHRVRDGKILFKLTPHRLPMIVDETFALHVDKVKAETSLPVHYGRADELGCQTLRTIGD